MATRIRPSCPTRPSADRIGCSCSPRRPTGTTSFYAIWSWADAIWPAMIDIAPTKDESPIAPRWFQSWSGCLGLEVRRVGSMPAGSEESPPHSSRGCRNCSRATPTWSLAWFTQPLELCRWCDILYGLTRDRFRSARRRLSWANTPAASSRNWDSPTPKLQLFEKPEQCEKTLSVIRTTRNGLRQRTGWRAASSYQAGFRYPMPLHWGHNSRGAPNRVDPT
jgi:hypothetical protein